MEITEVEVVVGTYEELLLGYKVKCNENGYVIEQSFTDHSHAGCIKSVAISSQGILASGSTDESIRLLNLRSRKELGALMRHEGSINCLEYFKRSHLFSCSDDGTLCIWKTYTWECLRTLRGHQSDICWLSVHPSGRLALTVGKDKKLMTWNLVKGRILYKTNIKQCADIVLWSPTGDHFILVFGNKIDVYNTETAAISSTIAGEFRINSVLFLRENVLVYAGERGKIVFHDLQTEKELHYIDTGNNRIRGMCMTQPLGQIDSESKDDVLLIVASSDGFIKLYHVSLVTDSDVIQTAFLLEHNTKFRLTCVASTLHQLITEETAENKNKKPKKRQLVIEKSIDVVHGIVKKAKPDDGRDKKSAKKAPQESQSNEEIYTMLNKKKFNLKKGKDIQNPSYGPEKKILIPDTSSAKAKTGTKRKKTKPLKVKPKSV